MNRVQLSGVITDGPRFTEVSACVLGSFVLLVGRHEGAQQIIRVITRGPAAVQLKQFAEGETVKVSGSLRWQADGIEIWADEFKQHHEGAYRHNIATLNKGSYPRIHFRDK